jgi:hypothetical protein
MTRKLIAAFAAVSMFAPGLANAQVHQPHMYAALQDLQDALNELQIADSYGDHGGYAGRATQEIQHAIDNVQNGIAYRNDNPN